MRRAPRNSEYCEEQLLARHPWTAALLLGSVITPAAVILAVPAPRPVDVMLAWPLVLMDSWIGPGQNVGSAQKPVYEGTLVHVLAAVAGIVLTWLFYVFLARLAVWRLTRTAAGS
jgi:hypothetical protein